MGLFAVQMGLFAVQLAAAPGYCLSATPISAAKGQFCPRWPGDMGLFAVQMGLFAVQLGLRAPILDHAEAGPCVPIRPS